MYAVIETGGKQYKVQPGDFIEIEKLTGDVGTAVTFDQVLFVAKPGASADQPTTVLLGKPLLAGAKVTGEIVGQGRGKKILIIKMKRRKQYRRTQGHRQELTHLLVTGVEAKAGDAQTLSAADKATKLASFHSPLKAKGPSSTKPKSVLKGLQKLVGGTTEAAPKAKTAKKTATKTTKAKKA